MKEVGVLFWRFIANECDVKEFEASVYSMSEIENQISEEDYLNLIYIDYNLSSAAYESKKIIRKYVDTSEYYRWYLKKLLHKIIVRAPEVHYDIEECYELYCMGLGFLDNLGLGYGLAIVCPPEYYSADNWEKLMDAEKSKLINSMYPEISREAQRVVDWLERKEVVVSESSCDDGGCDLSFVDNRSVEDKKSARFVVR